MRLLHVHTLDFKEFLDPAKRPKYAIASHRWYAGDETSLSDFRKRRNTEAAGYKKVKDFAQYVRANLPSLDWLWIDTCCINSKSTTEVSEAINSMFKWYQESEICLAYLYDVHAANDTGSLQKSEWFDRGWTLQELLAPSVVMFLTKDWKTIGHKGATTKALALGFLELGPRLDECIAARTGVPEIVLSDYSRSSELAPQEKLQWVADRRTTRPEDSAYCMLGVLEVSMNIRYGDGAERTRSRLLKKLKRRERETLNNSARSPALPASIPSKAFALVDDGNSTDEDTDEVVLGSSGFLAFATELTDGARRIKKLCPTTIVPPARFKDIADEMNIFAQTLDNLEKDRRNNTRNKIDAAIEQRCIKIFDQALRNIRRAVGQLQNIASQQKDNATWFNTSEANQACHDLVGARTYLAFGYELYNDARRKLDTDLILSLLSSSTIQAEYTRDFGTNARDLPRLTSHIGGRASTDVGRDSPYRFEVVSSSVATVHPPPRRKHRRRPWRLRFTPWFASQVWEISWGFIPGPKSMNLVPKDATILEACRDGDLRAVQTLFHEGKASPYDYYTDPRRRFLGDTVLSAAASSGNVRLCRYLIEQAGCPPAPRDTQDLLTAFMSTRRTGQHKDNAAAMYSLILGLPEQDYDLVSEIDSPDWWRACPNASCLRLTRESFTSRLEDLPWPTHVGFALECCGSIIDDLPARYMEALGVRSIDRRVALACDNSRLTILHVVANLCFKRVSSQLFSTLVDFIRALIEAGADVHQMTRGGETPMFFSMRTTFGQLRTWLALLKAAGVDLVKYGLIETRIWKEFHPHGRQRVTSRVTGFTFGERVEDWSFSAVHVVHRAIRIYRIDCPPGSWEDKDPLAIREICWYPELEDSRGPWPWKCVRTVPIKSASNGHSGTPDDYSLDHNISPLKLRSQDDGDEIMRMVQNCSRIKYRFRRGSLPILERMKHGRWAGRVWIPHFHKCLSDGQLKPGAVSSLNYHFSYDVEHRHCARGLHDYDQQRVLGDIERAVTREMRSFQRRYTNLAELHALPYAAYHRLWRSDKQWDGPDVC